MGSRTSACTTVRFFFFFPSLKNAKLVGQCCRCRRTYVHIRQRCGIFLFFFLPLSAIVPSSRSISSIWLSERVWSLSLSLSPFHCWAFCCCWAVYSFLTTATNNVRPVWIQCCEMESPSKKCYNTKIPLFFLIRTDYLPPSLMLGVPNLNFFCLTYTKRAEPPPERGGEDDDDKSTSLIPHIKMASIDRQKPVVIY